MLMSNILAGLFGHHSDYKKIEADLENSGFKDSEYIVYLHDDELHSQYLVSVVVKDEHQTDSASGIFSENDVLKTYLFENMEIEQANYMNIKRFIDARNKAEIHNSPDVKIKISTAGIDSEVKF